MKGRNKYQEMQKCCGSEGVPDGLSHGQEVTMRQPLIRPLW